MADPLSISAGIIAVLGAAKRVCDFVDRIHGAPEVLHRAIVDLKATVDVVEELQALLSGNTTRPAAIGVGSKPPTRRETDVSRFSRDSKLPVVLRNCQATCEAFETKIMKFDKQAEGGKMNLVDQARLALKEKDIEKFRQDIASVRQSICVAVGTLNLLVSEQNFEFITNFQRNTELAIGEINKQLSKLQLVIGELEEDNPVFEAYRGRELALQQQLRLCEESLAAVKEQNQYKQVWGDNKFTDQARSFLGASTQALQGSFEQRYGNGDFGGQSVTFMGIGDPASINSFFHQGLQQRQAQLARATDDVYDSNYNRSAKPETSNAPNAANATRQHWGQRGCQKTYTGWLNSNSSSTLGHHHDDFRHY